MEVDQEWVTRPERSYVGVIRFIVWFALTFGRPATRLLLYPISLYYVLFSSKARRSSRDYLQRALARRPSLRDVFRHYLFFASTILDRVFLLSGRSELFEIHLHGDGVIQEVIAGKQGFFLVSAHMGSFEVLHAVGRAQGQIEASMVMYEENARKLGSVLRSINPDANPTVIPLGRIDSMLKIQEALERGECIGMLADRAISGEKMIDCDFLGGKMAFPLGPFRLAAMLRRPVILMLGLYQGANRYEVYVENLGDLAKTERGERETAVAAMVQRYASRLEHHCRAHPYNWFNFYDVWH
ncbi:MAG TPA: acyl-CoA synthetase [Gammaproteobacteria bacterium]